MFTIRRITQAPRLSKSSSSSAQYSSMCATFSGRSPLHPQLKFQEQKNKIKKAQKQIHQRSVLNEWQVMQDPSMQTCKSALYQQKLKTEPKEDSIDSNMEEQKKTEESGKNQGIRLSNFMSQIKEDQQDLQETNRKKYKEVGTMTEKNYNLAYQHFPKILHNKSCNHGFRKNKKMLEKPCLKEQLSCHHAGWIKKSTFLKELQKENMKESCRLFKNMKYKNLERSEIERKLEIMAINSKYHPSPQEKTSGSKKLSILLGTHSYFLSIFTVFRLYLEFKSKDIQKVIILGKTHNQIVKPFLILYQALCLKAPIYINFENPLSDKFSPSNLFDLHKQEIIQQLFGQSEYGKQLKTIMNNISKEHKSRFQLYEDLYDKYKMYPFMDHDQISDQMFSRLPFLKGEQREDDANLRKEMSEWAPSENENFQEYMARGSESVQSSKKTIKNIEELADNAEDRDIAQISKQSAEQEERKQPSQKVVEHQAISKEERVHNLSKRQQQVGPQPKSPSQFSEKMKNQLKELADEANQILKFRP